MLAEISNAAAVLFEKYLGQHDISTSQGKKAAIDYAFGLATKYGESSASLSCQMYDAIAAASGAHLPPAEPAPTATYKEVAKAFYGTLKNQDNSLPQTVGRLVKQAGADTTLKNAARDGAEFAWIPHGDTCAFCIMLASNGWQRISKKALKGGHAEHIHDNCDCEYAIRFDGKPEYPWHDPDKYKRIYDNAEGDTPEEKANSIRREYYAEHKDEINAQSREAYAKRNEFRSVLDAYTKTATSGIGEFVVPEGRKFKNREEDNMKLIFNSFGGDIEALPEYHKQKNPDYRWRGHYWEEQEPKAYTKNAVDNNTREALHQIRDNPGGIILDIGESDMPKEQVKTIILARLRRSATFDCDVMVVRQGQIEDIYRYKKKK